MSSVLREAKNPHKDNFEPVESDRRSWELIGLGVFLVIASAVLFWWGWRNLPNLLELTEDKYLQRTPPPSQAAGKIPPPDSLPSASVTPQLNRPNPGSRKRTSSRRRSPARTEAAPSKPESDFERLYRELKASIEAAEKLATATEAKDKTPGAKQPPALASSPLETASPISPPSSSSSSDLSNPSSQATSSPSPMAQVSPVLTTTPKKGCGGTIKKPNVFRRVIDWVIHLFKSRNENQVGPCPNAEPAVSVVSSESSILLPCPPGTSGESCTASASRSVDLSADAKDPDNDTLLYTWSVTGGKLSSEGRAVVWDLSAVNPGTYAATVEVNDGNAHTAISSTTVTVVDCTGCVPPCPTLSVSCPSQVDPGKPITFSASVSSESSLTYNWSVSTGTISSGQGTSSINVKTAGIGGETVTATLELGGLDQACSRTASCSTSVMPPPPPDTGGIRAIVRDRHNRPIRRATIIVLNSMGNEVARGATDDNGVFETAGLVAGQYKLRVSGPIATLDNAITVQVNAVTSQTLVLPIDNIALTAAPSPDASPTPIPLPSASPTPLKIVKESDQITAIYPDRFLKDKDSRVSVELERVLREVERSQEFGFKDGMVKLVDKPYAPMGAKDDTVTPADNSRLYETHVIVELAGTGLMVPPAQASQSKLYSKADQDPRDTPKQDWNWNVRPVPGFTGQAELHFQMFVIWRSTNPAVKDRERIKVWESTKPVNIGKPALLVYGSTYGSPLVLLGAAGVIRKGSKKRKRSPVGEVEVDGLEDKSSLAVAGEEVGDEVTSTVYAPGRARPGDFFFVQVFLHLPEQSSLLEGLAKMSDEDAQKRDYAKLKKKIPRGTQLSFHCTMPGLEVDDPDQSCVWQGEIERVRFGVTVPKQLRSIDIEATVIVARNTVPMGHLKFKFKIVSGGTEEVDIATAQAARLASLTRYTQAFISYADEDLSEVARRVQMLQALDIKFFQDVISLKPGQRWEPIIFQQIDASDAFFLFWSTAASKSDFVKREITYANKRKGGKDQSPPEIITVIIEGPPAPKPPPELSFLHFRDALLYFINPGQADPKPESDKVQR